MERIKLTKNEKNVLRMVMTDTKPSHYPAHLYASAVLSLERLGLVKAFWAEETDMPVCVTITNYGRAYLAENPSLRNPTNWTAITAIATSITAVLALIALFIACAK